MLETPRELDDLSFGSSWDRYADVGEVVIGVATDDRPRGTQARAFDINFGVPILTPVGLGGSRPKSHHSHNRQQCCHQFHAPYHNCLLPTRCPLGGRYFL